MQKTRVPSGRRCLCRHCMYPDCVELMPYSLLRASACSCHWRACWYSAAHVCAALVEEEEGEGPPAARALAFRGQLP